MGPPRCSQARSSNTLDIQRAFIEESASPGPSQYVDYKDIELLKKLTNRQGKIIGRRKSGCTAVSQHAVARAIKRARFMAMLPYVGE